MFAVDIFITQQSRVSASPWEQRRISLDHRSPGSLHTPQCMHFLVSS